MKQLTDTQKADLVVRYKKGESYKQVQYETGIPIGTMASFIRREHPDLQRQSQRKREVWTKMYTARIAKDLGIDDGNAMLIYLTMKERFDVKKKNCLRKGTEFTIDFTQLHFPLVCPYLGIKLNYFAEYSKADNYPTFDRIDNTKGYVPGNVYIVSWRGNRIKNDSTAAELLMLATNVAKLLG